MTTQRYSNSHINRENVYIPEHPVRRWLLPLIAGFAGLLFGYGVAGGSGEDPSANCSALADEYVALVSEGIDAGLSMDESWMAEVAAKRDVLRESIEDTCG